MTSIKNITRQKFKNWQLALSYLIPVKLEEKNFPGVERLQLVLSRGEPHLYTTNAIYSNGMNYRPFKKTLSEIYNKSPKPNTMLMLGAGLGAGLQQLQNNFDAFPQSILVDTNDTIIDWAQRYTDINQKNNVTWVCEDAEQYVKSEGMQYDLIAIDAFDKLDTRSFVFKTEFLDNIKKLSAPGGWIIINIIVPQKEISQSFYNLLSQKFDQVTMLNDGLNFYFMISN